MGTAALTPGRVLNTFVDPCYAARSYPQFCDNHRSHRETYLREKHQLCILFDVHREGDAIAGDEASTICYHVNYGYAILLQSRR